MGARRAVLVAASEFKDGAAFPPLRFPTQDAARLRDVLLDRNLCFFDEAELISNGTASAAVRALEKFARKSEPEDLLLFYYSGHGQLDRDGTLALAMPDSERDYLSTTSLISEELKRLFRMSRATHKIMILDCCYSGAASDAQFKGTLTDSITALAQQIAGSFLLTASSRFEPAFECDTLQGGALTSCLIEGIATGAAAPPGAKAVTLAQLASYVRKQVPGFGAQQPQSWDLGGIGDLPLAMKPPRFDSAWVRRARQKVTLWTKSGRIDEDMADDIGRAIRNHDDAAQAPKIALIDRWLQDNLPASVFVREWDRVLGAEGAAAGGDPAPAGAPPAPAETAPAPAEPPEQPGDPGPPARPAVDWIAAAIAEPAGAETSARMAAAGGAGARAAGQGALPGSRGPSGGEGGAPQGDDGAEADWPRRILLAALGFFLLYVLVATIGSMDEDVSANNTAIYYEDELMNAADTLDATTTNTVTTTDAIDPEAINGAESLENTTDYSNVAGM